MKIMRNGMGGRRRRCSVAIVVMFAMGSLGACGGSVARAGKSVGRDEVTQIVTDEYVVLVPHVLGGEGGWCMVRPRANFGPGPCEDSPGVGPILAESWAASSGAGSGASGSESPVAKGVAVTTSAVASVSVSGGRPIPTRPEGVLPSGVRAVSVELRGPTQPKSEIEFALTRRRFTPVNSHGLAMPQTGAGLVLGFKAPASTWRSSEREPAGLCTIAPDAVDGLRALGGAVATRVVSADDVPGEPLLSCISVRYGGRGSSLIASVLLDARHLGRAPGVLPTAQLISGGSGVYSALGDAGAMVARRIPGAWLVVSGGDSQNQRLRLLMQLDAAIRP
jgi:hypothetical protein